ncbi:hypothetical protein Hanom_Chr07g00680871 [Helianthus anomalus]
MPFFSVRFGRFWDFRPKVSFYASGYKRFEILPFSFGSSFFSSKLGVFSFLMLI